jgi:tetratricopeptide (TPR) repeat protein
VQYALLDVEAAEQSYRQSLNLTQRLNGNSHHQTLLTEARLGAFLHETGRRSEGDALLQRALEEIERDPEKQDQAVAGVVYELYGRSLLSAGRLKESEPYLARAAEVSQRLQQDTPYAHALLGQSLLFTALGRYDSATRTLSEALRIWRHATDKGVEAALSNPFLLAQVELALAQRDTATALGTLGNIEPSRQSEAAKSLDEARAHIWQARIQLAAGHAPEAADTAQTALAGIGHAPWRRFFPSLESDAQLALGEASLRTGTWPKRGRSRSAIENP